MTRTLATMGVMLAAVAGGCATSRSTATLSPVTDGQAVAASTYDVSVDGQPDGEVTFLPARIERLPQSRTLAHVNMRVVNRSSCDFQIPVHDIYLSDGSAAQMPVTELDRSAVPDAPIVVPAGGSRTVDLAFQIPPELATNRIDRANLQWTLLVDGNDQPIVRTATFASSAILASAARSRDQAGYDLPAMPDTHGVQQQRNNDFNYQQQQVTGQKERAIPLMKGPQ